MKRGIFGKLFFLIFIAFVLAIAVGAVYLYDYHVFKEMRVCINDNFQDTQINCESDNYCLDLFQNNMTNFSKNIYLMPDFLRIKTTEIFSSAVYCEDTCKIKEIYGMGFNNTDNVQACKEGEKEILIQIHGKEYIQLGDFLRKNPEQVITGSYLRKFI